MRRDKGFIDPQTALAPRDQTIARCAISGHSSVMDTGTKEIAVISANPIATSRTSAPTRRNFRGTRTRPNADEPARFGADDLALEDDGRLREQPRLALGLVLGREVESAERRGIRDNSYN